MSEIYVTITAYSGGPEPKARSMQALAGAPMPVRLDRWAAEASAFIVSLPPGTVVADPDLLTRATDPSDTPTLRADARYLRGLAALGPADWAAEDAQRCERIAARLDAVAAVLLPEEGA